MAFLLTTQTASRRMLRPILQQGYRYNHHGSWRTTGRRLAPLLGSNDWYYPQDKRQQQQRLYHATSKREIVPLLVGGALVLLTVRYSYKALQRMKVEWEDYEWELQQYQLQQQQNKQSNTTTLGLDLGSIHSKMACQKKNQSQSEILVNRRGSRFTFAGVGLSDNDTPVLGQDAMLQYYQERFFKTDKVKFPYKDPTVAVKHVLPTLVEYAKSTLDDGTMRLVVAVPHTKVQDYTIMLKEQKVSIAADNDDVVVVPEPVAAVWGAQSQGLLDQPDKDPILVVDVGGHVASSSLVQKYNVLHSVSLPNILTGETWLDVMVNLMLSEATDIVGLDQDAMAIQRLYQAAFEAIQEYNIHTQAHVHAPYIGMDLKTRQAQHLDMHLSKSRVEQEFHKTVQSQLANDADLQDLVSSSQVKPTDVSSMLVSILTRLFMDANMIPMSLQHVLVVGGGTRQQLMVQCIRNAMTTLGVTDINRLVIPTVPSLRSELVALGAASCPWNYNSSNK